MTKQSGRYGHWRIINLLVVGVMIGSVMLTGFFIYQNLFTTLNNAYIVTVLSSDLGVDTVDLNNYERAQTILEQKRREFKIPADLRNIFIYASPTSTVSTTSNASAKKTK